jgi:hypothetical protein
MVILGYEILKRAIIAIALLLCINYKEIIL